MGWCREAGGFVHRSWTRHVVINGRGTRICCGIYADLNIFFDLFFQLLFQLTLLLRTSKSSPSSWFGENLKLQGKSQSLQLFGGKYAEGECSVNSVNSVGAADCLQPVCCKLSATRTTLKPGLFMGSPPRANPSGENIVPGKARNPKFPTETSSTRRTIV